MTADDAEAAGADRLFLDRARGRRESREHHVLPGRRALAGEAQAVLSDGAEIGRQPVAEIDEAVRPAQSGLSAEARRGAISGMAKRRSLRRRKGVSKNR